MNKLYSATNLTFQIGEKVFFRRDAPKKASRKRHLSTPRCLQGVVMKFHTLNNKYEISYEEKGEKKQSTISACCIAKRRDRIETEIEENPSSMDLVREVYFCVFFDIPPFNSQI